MSLPCHFPFNSLTLSLTSSFLPHIYPLPWEDQAVRLVQRAEVHLSGAEAEGHHREGAEQFACRSGVDARRRQFRPTQYLPCGRSRAAHVPHQVVEGHLLASRLGQSARREPRTQHVPHTESPTLSCQQLTGGLQPPPQSLETLFCIIYYQHFKYKFTKYKVQKSNYELQITNYFCIYSPPH